MKKSYMANAARTSRIVSISLSKETSKELDRLARERELSRSALLREALQEYRRARERTELERLLRLGSRYGRAASVRTEASVARLLHPEKRTPSRARSSRARRP